jgi:tellurite resistance protein
MNVHAKPSVHELDEPKLEALIEVMFLAAYADGEFSDTERGHFTKSVESLTDRRVAGEALDALVARLEQGHRDLGRDARLVAVKQALSDGPARKVALSLAIQLMAADGILRTSERELIFELAEALEIDRDVAANLVSKLAPS